MSTSTDILAWHRDYWDRLARHDGLRPVIDPADARGDKNTRTNTAHQVQVRRFLRASGLRSIGTVLDFGCGIGRHYDLLTSVARRYVGVDITASMLERAPGDVRLIDGTTLPFDGATFDCIFCFWVLQHVTDPAALDAIVAEFRRCLAPGGAVVICERSSRTPHEPDQPDEYILRRPIAEYVDVFARHGLCCRRVRKMTTGRPRGRNLLRRVHHEGDNLYAFVS
ncbi:MAG: class I SAM-dependent methyltransferase [Planctomycetota bacterium]|jgi:SAM-dependent methyltransferase